MTEPVSAPLYSVQCQRCLTIVSRGNEPPGDAQAMLTAFAEADCPIGGTIAGCPNTAEAVETTREERPAELRRLIRAARARLPRIARRVLPALTTGPPVEVGVTWGEPLPDDTYAITMGVIAATPGVIHTAVKPGSITPTGVIVLVSATAAVSANSAGLHVTATP